MANYSIREESNEKHGQVRELTLFGGYSNGSDKFPTNKIWSSRFSVKSIVPNSIFEQFMNQSNIWFLFIIILSFVYNKETYWNSLSRLIPLILILGLNLFKDILSFMQQRKADKKFNLEKYLVWNGQDFEEKLSMDLQVGDILLIFDDRIIPADLLLLCTDNYKECFADTLSVLGERNLQLKKPVKDTQAALYGNDLSEVFTNLKRINGNITVINKSKAQGFTGKIRLRICPKATRLTYENLLLKGTTVKNVHWIIAYILYTGPETCFCPDRKKRKVPTTNKKLENWNTLTILIILIISMIGFTIGQVYYENSEPGYNFSGLIIEVQNLIPISLYLVIYIIRSVKSYQIESKGLALNVNNPEVLEDLGNVDYLVVNKTGTLTENQLMALVCVVNDKVYWKHPNCVSEDFIEFKDSGKGLNLFDTEGLTFEHLKGHAKAIGSLSYHFLMCMALCNNTSTKGMGEEYFSMSEDDKVLVETSMLLGLKLLSRSSGALILNFDGEELEFMVIGNQPFTSLNKKCRIVVKNPHQDCAFLYVKGSKEDMLDIFSLTYEEKTSIEEFTLSKTLIKMRFIMMGYKKLNSAELENFDFSYQTAISSPVNSLGRIDDLFETLEKDLEFLGIVAIEDLIQESTSNSLKLLSQAGVKTWITSGDNEESTLIAGVGSKLFEENVRMVRLSNFSSENECRSIMVQQIKDHIKHDHSLKSKPSNSFIQDNQEEEDGSCSMRRRSEPLIFPTSHSGFHFQNNSKPSSLLSISGPLKEGETFIQRLSSADKIQFNPNSVYFVLSVDKSGLDYGLANEENSKLFVSLLFAAHCVCFHSLQSEDKTKVIRILKNNFRFKPVVLAISDGNCDAGMIQEAHIGINLDKTGSQLVNVSDFSVSKFSDLHGLMLFEGHWSQMNLSGILFYSIYSNSLLSTVLFLFNIFSQFSGTVLVTDQLLVIYTIILPIIQMVFVGIYDKDLTEEQLNTFPQVYSLGVHKEIITYGKLTFELFEGMIHGVIISILFYLSAYQVISVEGFEISFYYLGYSLILSVFVISSLKLFNETHCLCLKTLIGHFFAAVITVIHVVVNTYMDSEWTGFAYSLYKVPALMITCFLTPVIIFSLQVAVKYAKSLFWPDVLQYVKSIHMKDLTFDLVSRLESFKNELQRVYVKSRGYESKQETESLSFNNMTLRFLSSEKENDYNRNKIQDNLKIFRQLLVSSFICLCLLVVLISSLNEILSYPYYSILPILLLICLCFVFYSYSRKIYKTFRLFLSFYYIFILAFLVIAGEVFDFYYIEANSVLIPIFLIAVNSDWFYTASIACFSIIPTIFNTIRYYKTIEYPPEHILAFILFYVALLCNSAAVGHSIDKTKRQEFILIQKVENEVDKSKNILSYLLPAFVRKRVKDGVKYISDDQGTVSVFFCDIMDFEEIVAAFTPLELTTFLDDVFGKFDTLCRTVGVTKIETVGKTYMACAGLKDSEEELDPYFSTVAHARRAIELGIGILRIANSIKVRKGVTLSVKIGVNSGTVTAGVIGYHKPQFSLVGDTVNTASRMASTCPSPNSIQISKSTYDILDDKRGLVFTPRTEEVKGKGKMDTFMVRLPVGVLENTIYENTQQLNARVNNSPQGISARTVTYFPRSSFVESATMHERRISTLLTHLEVSDPFQLFFRKDTEVIERVMWFSFSCTENIKERRFRLETLENKKPVIMWAMGNIIICNIAVGIIYLTSFSEDRVKNFYFLLKLLVETICELCLLVLIKYYLSELWFAWLLQLVYVLSIIFEIIIGFLEGLDTSLAFLIFLNHVLLFSHCAELFFKHNLWSLIFVTVLRIVSIFLENVKKNVFSALFTIIGVCTLIFTTFTIERMLRINSTLKAAANKELDKTEKLIKKMMPPHVVQKMKEESSFTDKIQHVTVLYADIVGFTLWSSTRTPEEIVGMLSELFTLFDKNCVNHNVYKVHTIGDCYVAMGYVGEANRNHVQECLNIIEFAQQTIEIIQEINEENGISLNMRIGIHTGDVTAGVTGTNIVRYDIYGNDVMIANKIESCGVPGKICISEATKNLIESAPDNYLKFTPHKDFFVKSAKKTIRTFLLE